MKTTILLATVLLFVSFFSNAQTEKGAIQIGGSVGVNHQETDEIPQVSTAQKYTYVSASPSIGRFYKNNKLIGAFLNFSYYETMYSNKNISRSFGGGVFIRQYQPVIKSLYLFFDERARFNYDNGKNIYYTQTGEEYDNKFHGFAVGISAQAGMAYNITKRAQLEMLMNNLLYASFSSYNTGKNYTVSSSLDGNAFSNIFFGFRYYLK